MARRKHNVGIPYRRGRDAINWTTGRCEKELGELRGGSRILAGTNYCMSCVEQIALGPPIDANVKSDYGGCSRQGV